MSGRPRDYGGFSRAPAAPAGTRRAHTCHQHACARRAPAETPVAAASDPPYFRSRALTRQVGELVLADLQLVAVLELVRVDPPAVHVGAVQGARVVQVPGARAAHEHRVVARDGDVVE